MDEIIASSNISKEAGGMYNEDEVSVSVTKFVSCLGRECNIGRGHLKFEKRQQ